MVPQGDASSVTRTIYGRNVFVSKVSQVFSNFNGMIGRRSVSLI
jgi:hypothetical protein